MTSAAATTASTPATCFHISEATPGVFQNSNRVLSVQSTSDDTLLDARRKESESCSDRTPHSPRCLLGQSTTSVCAGNKTASPSKQAQKSFGTWLSPKKGRRSGVHNRSLPLPDLADEGTDASSSGLEEGFSLVPPSFRNARKISNASSLESATEASSSLPSPLLPAFVSSPASLLQNKSAARHKKQSVEEEGLPDCSEGQGQYKAAAPAPSSAHLGGLFGPVSDSQLDTSQLCRDRDQTTAARLELQRSVRKLDSALAKLRRCQSALVATSVGDVAVDESLQDLTATGTPVSPDGNIRYEQGHLSPPGNRTPTRSRLFRSLGRTPTPSSRRGSPHLASPGTPESPSNFRSWSSALHAILSPSPTLPRMFSSPSPRTDSPSSVVEQLESAQLGIDNLVNQVRRAQADLLGAIDQVYDRSTIPLGPVSGPREPVLFLAQAIVTGLELPAAGAAAAKFEALKHAADAVLSAFAGILEKQRPLACKLPDAGMSHAHILLHSFGDKLDVTTTYDVFASDGDTGSSDGEVKQHAQIFLDAYGSLAGELRNYHSAARQERRQHRIDRRTARLHKAGAVYGKQVSGKQHDEATIAEAPDQAHSNLNIALLSSQELFEHTLNRALRENLYTAEEVEAYEPRVILTLPRLAIAFGVRESSFPTLQPEQPDLVRAGSSQVLLEVFLPRMCRALPIAAAHRIKAMSAADFERMVHRLCIADGHRPEAITGDEEPLVQMDDIFRAVSTLADSSGVSNKGRHTKIMRKVLRSYLAISEGRKEDDDEDEYTIARAFLAVAGLG